MISGIDSYVLCMKVTKIASQNYSICETHRCVFDSGSKKIPEPYSLRTDAGVLGSK